MTHRRQDPEWGDSEGETDMIQRICPICDQVMKSAHYCRQCRRWVKHPYVRDAACYLNERHPQDEAECSYHVMERQSVQQPMQQPMRQPVQSAQPTHPAHSIQQSSQDGAWKPVKLPQGGTGSARPARRPGLEKSARPRSGNWAALGIFLVAAVISILSAVSGPLSDMVRGVLEPASEYDIDLGDYTGEDGSNHELEEADVIARGAECNTRGHFAVKGKDMERPVQEVLRAAGLQVVRTNTYSYNEAYDDGETWFTTWTTIELAGEGEDSYQYVELDSDTGTGRLHEISISLDDPGQLAAVASSILKLLAAEGELPADSPCFAQVEAELPGAMTGGSGYDLLEGPVLIEGISYEKSYSVYISHNMDSDL